jgi:hypothetical protein
MFVNSTISLRDIFLSLTAILKQPLRVPLPTLHERRRLLRTVVASSIVGVTDRTRKVFPTSPLRERFPTSPLRDVTTPKTVRRYDSVEKLHAPPTGAAVPLRIRRTRMRRSLGLLRLSAPAHGDMATKPKSKFAT